MTNCATENQKEHDWIEDHQHHLRGEVTNAATPSSSELPASSFRSGITGHEHVEPEHEFEIQRPTERAGTVEVTGSASGTTSAKGAA